jgi:hypothetical protein
MTVPRSNAGHDQNRTPTLIGVSTTDGTTPVTVEVDPLTGGVVTTTGTLLTQAYDYMSVAYPDAVTEIYTYKFGGSGGTTVATVTMVYTDSTKAAISTITKV